MSNILNTTTIASVNSSSGAKAVWLPSSYGISGKYVTVKDVGGIASVNNITINTEAGDRFQDGTSNRVIRTNFGFGTFYVKSNIWFEITDSSFLNNELRLGLSSIYSPYGVSSLSSIVSYGLSSVYSPYGISSLSSIVSYGLSTIAAQPHSGVSSLSSIVSYGLSTVAAQPHSGVSSLSSIVSYGLSSIYSPYGVS